MDVAGLRVLISGDASKLSGELKKAEGSLQTFSGSFKKIAGTLGPLLGTALSVGAVNNFINKMEDLNSELTKMQSKTGMSKEALQEWGYAAKMVDASMGSIQMAAIGLTQRVATLDSGSTDLTDSLKRLGISLFDGSGQMKSMNDLLPDIIGELAGMENMTERNALAADLLGRGWKELTPLLALGKEGIEELKKEAHKFGAVLDDDLLDKYDELEAAQKRLGSVWKSVWADMIVSITPKLVDLAEKLTKIANAIKFIKQSFGKFNVGKSIERANIDDILADFNKNNSVKPDTWKKYFYSQMGLDYGMLKKMQPKTTPETPTEEPTDVLDDLLERIKEENDLIKQGADDLISELETNHRNIYDEAIEFSNNLKERADGWADGYEKAAEAAKFYEATLKEVNDVIFNATATDYEKSKKAIIDYYEALILKANEAKLSMEDINKLVKAQQIEIAKLGEATLDVTSLVSGAIISMTSMMGAAMGGAKSEWADWIKLFGNLLQQIGAAMISLGTAKAALKSINMNPYTMIAVGVATTLAGSAINAWANSKQADMAKFAEGGIVFSPTVGMIGEYPSARTNPEIIAPLDKLKSLLNMGQNQAVFTIRGDDLVAVLSKANTRQSFSRV